MEDIRSVPHFCASPGFFAGKELSVAIPTQLAWQLAFVSDIPDP
jgi:hypothetical protein